MTVKIIDGVATSWKSTALKEIQKKLVEKVPNYSKFIISEHFTERHFEGKETLKETVEDHIESILESVWRFKDLHRKNKFAQKSDVLSVYIERLLLTFFSRKILDESSFMRLEPLFSSLDCKHILLTIPANKFEERLSSSLKIRNEFWSKYINDEFGGLEWAIIHFQNQQKNMIKWHEVLSKYMSTEIIEVDDVTSNFYEKI